jgi:hypothetical protein
MDVVLAELEVMLGVAPAAATPDPAAASTAGLSVSTAAASTAGSSGASSPRPTLPPPASQSSGPPPVLLDTLLSRPYGPKLHKDVAELLTWEALEQMLSDGPDATTALVNVEGKGQITVVFSDLKALAKRYAQVGREWGRSRVQADGCCAALTKSRPHGRHTPALLVFYVQSHARHCAVLAVRSRRATPITCPILRIVRP